MQEQWAIDLGTTNSVVAMAEGGSARLVHLRDITRKLPVDQSPLIPSAVHLSEEYQKFLWVFRRKQLIAYVGQEALGRNFDGRSPAFAQSFKRHLANQPHKIMARVNGAEYSARDVARFFLREVLKRLREERGVKIQDLTIPSPVAYFEPYRAELRSIVSTLGIKRFRSLDEPVAAAIGYGVNVAREERLLVVDFGGGTLNLAVVKLGPETAETGGAPVLAKHMIGLGGDDVDRWVLEHFVPAKQRDFAEWQRDAIWEAMFVKERVSSEGSGEFRWGGIQAKMTKAELGKILRERGLLEQLAYALADIRKQLGEQTGESAPSVDEVLLVGGSTLLPEVAAVVDDAFPDAVARYDPEFVFTSVALGSARYAGGVAVDDFVYHDYALAVQNEKTHTVEYELLVPRRTRYPTSRDYTIRYYADYPGMTDVRFSVCEVGRLGQDPVPWQKRSNGSYYWAPQTDEERGLVVELNPGDPPMPLRPVGTGTSPRLRVIYSVNSDRWLCTTVDDLQRKEALRNGEPVVRLR